MGRPRKSDDLLVAALAQGKTHAGAARVAHVSERTVRRRFEDAEFAARVNEARGEATAATAAQLASLYTRAVEALGDLLDNKDPAIRLRTAQVLLKSGPEFRASTEFEQRLLAMETSVHTRS